MRVAKQPDRTPVTDLQEMLRLIDPTSALGYDGIYGEATEKAVKQVQKQLHQLMFCKVMLQMRLQVRMVV